MFTEQTSNYAVSNSRPSGTRFQLPKQRVRKKVPPSGTYAVGALERKYQDTLGEIKTLEGAEYEWVGKDGFKLAEDYWRDRQRSLHSTLIALEKSIRMFDQKWSRKSLMVPTIRRNARPLFERTVFQKALIGLLRCATERLSILEIAEKLAPELGLPTPSAEQRARLRAMAYSSLRGYYDKGFVDCEGTPPRWFVRTSQADGIIETL
jgi:hypothetical protein